MPKDGGGELKPSYQQAHRRATLSGEELCDSVNALFINSPTDRYTLTSVVRAVPITTPCPFADGPLSASVVSNDLSCSAR